MLFKNFSLCNIYKDIMGHSEQHAKNAKITFVDGNFYYIIVFRLFKGRIHLMFALD